MPTLFTYCIPYDDGAAPNPFWGTCTLAICKPKIRLAAQVGDWVVGTGSANSPIGNISGQVVYAMRVTQKMPMPEYDVLTKNSLQKKIPDWNHDDHRRRVGDSIYDFSTNPPRQRKSVHNKGNFAKDLSGQFALLSNYFFYFGDQPYSLSGELLPIVKQGQGHRSISNAAYFDRFVDWIHRLGIEPNTLVGKPQIDLFEGEDLVAKCAKVKLEEDEKDADCE